MKDPQQTARREAVAAYAVEIAGTEFGLDRALEGASIELLIERDPGEDLTILSSRGTLLRGN